MTDETTTPNESETITLDDGEERVELNKQDVVELNEFLEHVQIVLLAHEQAIQTLASVVFADENTTDKEAPKLSVVTDETPDTA